MTFLEGCVEGSDGGEERLVRRPGHDRQHVEIAPCRGEVA
jgi:hypothetical protein